MPSAFWPKTANTAGSSLAARPFVGNEISEMSGNSSYFQNHSPPKRLPCGRLACISHLRTTPNTKMAEVLGSEAQMREHLPPQAATRPVMEAFNRSVEVRP